MNKRIRKKKIRMELIRELEKINDGDGVVFVDGKTIMFSNSCAEIHPTDDMWPDITIRAYITYVRCRNNVKFKKQKGVK